MRTIPLTQDYEATVDDEDYEELSKYSWRIDLPSLNVARGKPSILMSRQIMKAPVHLEVDHRDGNRLDMRRSNLRLCTHAQNLMNQRPQQRTRSSMYKGVSWSKRMCKWESSIKFKQHNYHLSFWESEAQAAAAYDLAAVHFFGEFARLNFPEHIKIYEKYWEES